MNCLVILTGSLGDLIRGMALARPLAENSYNLTWVVEDKWKSILDTNPYISKQILFRRKLGTLGFIQMLKELRQDSYDLALDLQRNFRSGIISKSSKASKRIGFHPKNCKEFNQVFNTDYINYCSDDISKLDHYFEFLKKVNIKVPQIIDFGINKLPKLEIELPSQYVVLILGSSWQSKNWLTSGYEKLLSNLADQGIAAVLCGDPSQIETAANLTSVHPKVINLVAKTNLLELAAVIKSASACVGPDSGPAHLAGAFNVPHVTLFGPTSAERVAPYGSEDLSIVANVPCQGCYRRVCPGLNKVCMRLIDPQLVFDKLQVALGN